MIFPSINISETCDKYCQKCHSASRINFVTTHSAYLPNVNKILKRHGHYLREDGLERYVEELPRLSLRRGRNIGDLVVNAKKKREEGKRRRTEKKKRE